MPRFERFPGSWRHVGAATDDRLRAAARTLVAALSTLDATARWRWEDDGSFLVDTDGGRLALRVADLTALRLDADGRPTEVRALHGTTAGAERIDAFDRPALGDLARLINNADDALKATVGPPHLDASSGRYESADEAGTVAGLDLVEATWYVRGAQQADRTLGVSMSGSAIEQAEAVGRLLVQGDI